MAKGNLIRREIFNRYSRSGYSIQELEALSSYAIGYAQSLNFDCSVSEAIFEASLITGYFYE